MKQLPSRLRRLDGALADLPLEEPMLLSELDGFLTGILVSPEPIASGEWMQNVWGADDSEVAPFEDPLDAQWFADAVMAQHDSIVRDISRGKPQPLFDIDERNGDVLWEIWLDGFAEAMELRPDSWNELADAADPEVADAVSRLATLIAVARNESALDSMEINAMEDRAPSDIGDIVQRLSAARRRLTAGLATPMPVIETPAKIGRNDPCRCGSGKKSKRCCGAG